MKTYKVLKTDYCKRIHPPLSVILLAFT